MITIVTGGSSNHYKCLKNLLLSIKNLASLSRLIVYDLGLNKSEVNELVQMGYKPRRFKFEDYPSHVNIARNAGYYAWKPVIVTNVIDEVDGPVLWLDAGDLLSEPLDQLEKFLSNEGFYTPTSGGVIPEWTHPRTIDYLQCPKEYLSYSNRNAAIVGFWKGKKGMREFAQEWRRCCMDIDCVAPIGSDPGNHRWDQSILTILAYKLQRVYGYALTSDFFGLSCHNDDVPESEVRERLKYAVYRPHVIERVM